MLIKMNILLDDLLIIILTDVVSKRFHIQPVGSTEKDTRISYYSCRLVNKKWCYLITNEVLIPVLPVRIYFNKKIRLYTVFQRIELIVVRSSIISDDDDGTNSIPLNHYTKYILWNEKTNEIDEHFLCHSNGKRTEMINFKQIHKKANEMANKGSDISLQMEPLFLAIDNDNYREEIAMHDYHSDVLKSLLTHPLVWMGTEHVEMFKYFCRNKRYDMIKVLLEKREIDKARLDYHTEHYTHK